MLSGILRKKITFLLLTCLFVVQSNAGTFSTIPIGTRNENTKGYIEYLPSGFDPSGVNKYPILYWLHGVGEAGFGSADDLAKMSETNFYKWLQENDPGFIVIMPQDFNGIWAAAGVTRIKPFVDWVNTEYHDVIDTGQQHMAGLSGGGYGIRDFIIEGSDAYSAFSTFTLMSTNLNAANNYAENIINNDQFVWIHHGQDDVSPNAPSATFGFHKSIHDKDYRRSRLTIYEGVGHLAWEYVYNALGQQTPQLTTSSQVTLYEWKESDVDENWFEWMKSCGKSLATPPTMIAISKQSLEENSSAPFLIGTLASNGGKAVDYVLKEVGDFSFFYIEDDKLWSSSSFDFEEKSTYSITIEVIAPAGSFAEEIIISIIDIFDDITVSTEKRLFSQFTCYPNPINRRTLTIISDVDISDISKIDFIDYSGKSTTPPFVSSSSNEIHVNVSTLKSGVYLMRVTLRDGRSQISRIVKNI